ncbi:hypothetical protein LC653_17920 [Nostoc sp. CHAB 5784]|nr:hypothetical protein [Nostoc mirabile CHAB5784]
MFNDSTTAIIPGMGHWALGIGHTNSINDCNTSFGEDAMNRVSTNGLSVALFS